jgi:coatomer protein complex subunit alpha (xenin)
MQASEQQARNAHAIDYDEASGALLCASSLTPIAKGAPHVRAPFSGAAYHVQHKGTVCVVDGMSQIGVETLGLVCTLSRK